jgi:D-sedoheptulose 7-phosphate isomerase
LSFSRQYLTEAAQVVEQLDVDAIDRIVALLAETRGRGGRLFVLGVGGSAANASHAVNDFRKIVGLEAYTPVDNVAELTARVNDEGWASVFESWLRVSRLGPDDLVMVFSVGGGDVARNVSPNLVTALQYAKRVGARIAGVVGRDGGYTGQVADAVVIVPTVNPAHDTPHTEAFQAVIWHLLVSHPSRRRRPSGREFGEGSNLLRIPLRRKAAMKSLSTLKVKIFADGADRAGMLEMYRNPIIKGFTTNPTLMRKAGVTDYRAFALDILKAIPDRPISFEVFSDDFDDMVRQATEITRWAATSMRRSRSPTRWVSRRRRSSAPWSKRA